MLLCSFALFFQASWYNACCTGNVLREPISAWSHGYTEVLRPLHPSKCMPTLTHEIEIDLLLVFRKAKQQHPPNVDMCMYANFLGLAQMHLQHSSVLLKMEE